MEPLAEKIRLRLRLQSDALIVQGLHIQPYSVGSLFPALWEAHSRQLFSGSRESSHKGEEAGRGKEEWQKRRGGIPRIFRQVFKVRGVLIRAAGP